MHEYLIRDGLRCSFKISTDHSGSVLQSEWQLWFPHLWPDIPPSYLHWQLQGCSNPVRGRKQETTESSKWLPLSPLPKTTLSFRKHKNIFAEGAVLSVKLLCSSTLGIVSARGSSTELAALGTFLGTFWILFSACGRAGSENAHGSKILRIYPWLRINLKLWCKC